MVDKLKELFLRRVDAQSRLAEARKDLRVIEEEEKELFKRMKEKIRNSEGELTIENI